MYLSGYELVNRLFLHKSPHAFKYLLFLILAVFSVKICVLFKVFMFEPHSDLLQKISSLCGNIY